MMKNKNQYNALANIFRYPDQGYLNNVNECAELLHKSYPEAYKEFLPFLNVLNKKSIYDIEELFAKTFHIQAVCYLDIGYVLFAEDYKRGEFLVKMKNEQRKVNNDCGEELADNLPNVLALLPMIEDSSFLEEFASKIMIPALKTMLKEFEASRMELKTKVRRKKQKVLIQENIEHKNIYQYAINTTLKVIEIDFKHVVNQAQEIKPDIAGSFLPNCNTCSVEHTPPKIKEHEKAIEK